MAVVIISFGPRATLTAAVRSVLEQDERAEILVVHSGDGDPRPLLEASGLDVPVVVSAEPLYVGGARNLGIENTTAPIVAFLADDCTAEPGWVRERRLAHAAGHSAVASALVPHRPLHATTLAVHLSLHVLRMPSMPADIALRFGVSYSRDVLAANGPFDSFIPGGEDSVYNSRLLEQGIPILWAPQVVTVHRGHERLRDALADGYGRGRRRTRFRAEHGERERTRFISRFRRRLYDARVWLPMAVTPEQRSVVKRGIPAYVLCVVAITLGEWREGWRS